MHVYYYEAVYSQSYYTCTHIVQIYYYNIARMYGERGGNVKPMQYQSFQTAMLISTKVTWILHKPKIN